MMEYVNGVLDGSIPAGKLCRLACERHVRDIARQGTPEFPWVFQQSRGEHFENWCNLLKHFEGIYNGKPFLLEGFQKFICYSVFCWVDPLTGWRRFKTAVIRVPRKNGKTSLAAAMATYLLALDGEPGAQIYCAATKKDQARILFDICCKMISNAHPKVARRFIETKSKLAYPATNSRFEPLAANSRKLDGLNPHAAICDETHEWPSRALWDVMESGMGARRNALMVDISTAGFSTTCFAYETHKRAENILQQTLIDENYFCYVACADPEDILDWDNPAVWAKANPGYGTIKSKQHFETQAANVRAMPSKKTEFLTKELNIWTNAKERWIDPNDWKRGEVWDLKERLLGLPCIGALDLAKVSDLTAFALVFHPSVVMPAISINAYAVIAWHWCPEQDLINRSRIDFVPYDVWHRDGWISKTPGNVTDYGFVRDDILKICKNYQVKDIAFDRWDAAETVQAFQESGITMTEFGQGFRSMLQPTAEFERLIKGGMLIHEDNPLLEWEAGNVILERDAAGNAKPSKKISREKIDGIVAGIMGLGRHLVCEPTPSASPLIFSF